MTDPKAVSAPEPVAWRWRDRVDESWNGSLFPPVQREGREIEPLVPQSALASLVAERDEALVKHQQTEQLLFASEIREHNCRDIELPATINEWRKACLAERARAESAEAERDALREALHFYADPANWRDRPLKETTEPFPALELAFDGFHYKAKKGHAVPQVVRVTWTVAKAARTLSVEPK